MSGPHATAVLVLAGGGSWEGEALATLGVTPGVVVLKRCIDVADLLATAAAGQAGAAVVWAGAPGFDRPAVDHLHLHGVHAVAVVPGAWRDDEVEQLLRAGVAQVLPEHRIADLGGALTALRPRPAAPHETVAQPATAPGTGRAVAIWGPTGAPGRTTVALGLAGALTARGLDPLLIDLDPWGGTLAQHLGIVDQVSGLLAANRSHASGTLGPSYVALQRRVAGMRVLTGLPRAERWTEIRPAAVEEMVGLGRRQGPVVLDTGFALEDDPAADWSGRPGRNETTRTALRSADDVVVVGSADPIGLARLARGLTELRETLDLGAVHVVVNRMRRSLGWSEQEVVQMLRGFGPLHGLHFLPDDRATADRALLTGRTVLELGDSVLARGLAELAAAVLPGGTTSRRPRLRRRTGGRVRPR